jgi:hypothetical protein
MNGRVNALAVLPNGDLVAGGKFTTAGGVSANNIARWNGSTWAALGSGVNDTVWALAVLPNGDLVAGGNFSNAGGIGTSPIARWNGSTWAALGTGVSRNDGTPALVFALSVLPNGNLVAGGYFLRAGFLNANNIARWNGSTWAALGSGLSRSDTLPPAVYALSLLPNGDLVAGGDFTIAGGLTANRIARWNGSSWAALGSGLNGEVDVVAVLPNSDLMAGGSFTTAGGLIANRIARWNGAAWSALGTGLSGGNVFALAVLPNSDLVAGGTFSTAGGIVAPFIAKWVTPPSLAVVDDPDDTSINPGQTVILGAAVNAGISGVSVQWQRNGVNISNGPGGASPGGGIVSGAASSTPSPTTTAPITLTITNAQLGDSGSYTATFSDSCGSITSNPATLTIACKADFNTDGSIDGDDVISFFIAWDAGEQAGDYSNDGSVDGDDVISFFVDWDNQCAG